MSKKLTQNVKTEVTRVQTAVQTKGGFITAVNMYNLPGRWGRKELQETIFDVNARFDIDGLMAEREIIASDLKERIINIKVEKISADINICAVLKDAGVFTGHLSAEITDDAYVEVEVKEGEING